MRTRGMSEPIGSESAVLAAGLALLLSACATVFNPGDVEQTIKPASGQVERTASFMVKGWSWDTRIYEGSDEVPVYDREQEITDEKREACAAFRQLGDEDRLKVEMELNPAGKSAILGCAVIPVLRLSVERPHALRVVRGGDERTVTVKANWRWIWVWWNAWLGPAWPVGLAVDAMTKKWTYFSSLDLNRAFQPLPAGTR